jgi:ABC-type spermidine/putrescine transport system permease subunit II
MARLLLIPIAVLGLCAGLLPLIAAIIAASHGLTGGLVDPALLSVTRVTLLAAAVATAIAVPLGLTLALALRSTVTAVRPLAYGLAILVLVMPAPGFESLAFLSPPHPAQAVAFACCIARGAALATLILSAALRAIPPTLTTAARAVGARPGQAWCHAVLAPLTWPLLASALAAFIAGLVEGPGGAVLGPHLDLAEAWIAPAALLLTAASVAALATLARRPGA